MFLKNRSICVFLYFLFLCTLLQGQDNISLTGYGEISGLVGLADFSEPEKDQRFGAALSSTFRLELMPMSGITAVLEGTASFSGGYLNPLGRFEATGLPLDASFVRAGDLPGADFNALFSISQAWAAWSYNSINVSFGFIPISWGSAWLIHPSDRVNPRNLNSLFSDETKGVPSLTVDLALGWNFGASAYICLTDKSSDGLVSLDEVRPDKLPFGLKFMAYPAGWEISAGFVRETISSDVFIGNNWIVADITGNLGPFGITAESSLLLPEKDGDWDPVDALELSIGGTYLVDPINLEIMVEYTHLGAGSKDPDFYDITPFLEGTALFLARDYLFSRFSWSGAEAFTVDLAGIFNLNDGSVLLLPSLEWEPLTDLVFNVGLIFPFGKDSSEFGGTRPLGPGLSWKPWDAGTVICNMKVYY
ncbi:MAG: hypothetical protein JEY91_13400 [Spirochaetaceae bacterium]|nr:hypothetical protein [Spirochaetaceae bacterium]